MPEVRLTVTKCTIGGDWLVEDRDHIIAIFAAWNPAIRFAHDHATTAPQRHVEKLERNAHEARRAAEDNPKVKLGDRVAFDAFGRRVVGTVTRWDDDGITIREERW